MAFTIGILETGLPPVELAEEHGDYGNMFVGLLGAVDGEVDFNIYRVLEDQFPAAVGACDAWVVTGSRFGVYENLPWMQRLKAFLVECHGAGRKVVGICFGHQILAEAMGGKVVKSDKGWAIGPHSYSLTGTFPRMSEPSTSFTINAMHQDQVVELPPEAEVIATSDFCEYAGLAYGDWAISFQSHPEFSDAYEEALIQLRRESSFSDELAEEALAKLAGEELNNEGAKVASWMVNFLK